MPNFETVGDIVLQTGDEMPWSFYFPPAESATEKGAIPYDSNIASVVVTAYDENDVIVTSELIYGTPSVASNVITVVLKYPVTSLNGRYKLTFACTIDTGYTRQFDFDRVYARTT